MRITCRRSLSDGVKRGNLALFSLDFFLTRGRYYHIRRLPGHSDEAVMVEHVDTPDFATLYAAFFGDKSEDITFRQLLPSTGRDVEHLRPGI